MFQRILVPLDGSERAERALPIAARIAHATGGTIVLIQVVSIPMGYGPYLTQSSAYIQRVTGNEVAARHYLAEVATSEILSGIPAEIEVLHGAPALSLPDTLQQFHIDLVILCSHGTTGIKRWIVGSVAQQLVKHSSAPVLILREDGTLPLGSYPDATRPLRAFAATIALDGSERALSTLEPTAHLVAALAAPARGLLHITQVVPLPPESELHDTDSIDHAVREQAVCQVKKYLGRIADTLREGLAKELKLNVSWSITVDPDIANSLIEVAEKGVVTDGTRIAGGCDVLAMTTHGRGGRKPWILGTVTERVLGATRLPLLVVRPQASSPTSVCRADRDTSVIIDPCIVTAL